MNAIFENIDNYISLNQPENVVISEKEMDFFAGIYHFTIKPKYNSVREESFLEITMKVI